MKKSFGKSLFFIFGYVAAIGISLLSFAGVPDDAPMLREIGQMTLVELAGVAVMLLIYRFVYVRLFDNAREYCFKLPRKDILWGIFLIYPLICVIKVSILAGTSEPGCLWALETGWTREDICENLLSLPVVALIGPVMEELCCRIFPLSSYKSRIGKIIAGVVTIFLFAIMHISSWKNVIAGSILFTVAYLVTKNMAVSISLHVANNLATILIPTLSGLYVLANPSATRGFFYTPIPVVILTLAAFAVGAFLLIRALINAYD